MHHRIYYFAAVGILGALVVVQLTALAWTSGQNKGESLPIVSVAAVPMYPSTARVARIQGEVRIKVATDGKNVSSVAVEGGHPILAQAAQENIRTWKFEQHKPTTFVVKIIYEIEEKSTCSMDNGVVLMHLPSEIRITVTGIQTCDPTNGM